MRVLLTTLNARFSHASLALRYLRAVLRQNPALQVDLTEYTVNQSTDEVLSAIHEGAYDCVVFSTYIWNIEPIARIAASLRKISPEIRLLMGGPEVTFAPASTLKAYPFIDGLIMGEGEETIRRLFAEGFEKPGWQSHAGTAWNTPEGMRVNPAAQLISDLDTIPFPYDADEDLRDKLVYYESSRGCPYNCTYCLSSSEEGIRYFSLPRVFSDLDRLLALGVQTVKFVDRTFNTDPRRYMPIIEHLAAHDNGITCFHFEISAGILTADAIARFAALRPGLVQFEIGVQSTMPEALKACSRPDWTGDILRNAALLRSAGNIHIHLDLIAGLPYEGYERFLESFDAVYSAKPHMLQLGFLKLIKGTAMRRNASFYGFQWREEPPYEVLQTKWITYGELESLKRMEALLDRYYQDGRFERTLPLLEGQFQRPSELYSALSAWWQEKGCWSRSVGQDETWQLLYGFALSLGIPEGKARGALRWDAVRHWRPKTFTGTDLAAREPAKGLQHALLHTRDQADALWAPYGNTPVKELLKRFHFELFQPDELTGEHSEPVIWCFDTRPNPSQPVASWRLADAEAMARTAEGYAAP